MHIRIGRVSIETHKTNLKKFPLSPLLCAILHMTILYVIFRLPVCLAAIIQRIWNPSWRHCSGTCIMLFAFPPSTRNSPSLRDIKKSYVASLEPIKIIPTSAFVCSLLDKCNAHWVQGCDGKTQNTELKQWFADHSFLSVCFLHLRHRQTWTLWTGGSPDSTSGGSWFDSRLTGWSFPQKFAKVVLVLSGIDGLDWKPVCHISL